MRKLNCDEARKLSIVDYLAQCGFCPQYIKGANHWYLSPIREENTASFKVNTQLNAWFDHGMGVGGNFIDLGIRLHQCTVEQLLSRLSSGDRSLSFHLRVKETVAAPEHKIKIIQAGELQNLTLVKYLHDRAIDYSIARAWCREILFTLNEQQYLAIGFKNNSGGYELRNPQLKLSSSPKDLTYIDKGADTVHVFEGFTDYLSLLTLNGRDTPGNFLVLNSLSFVSKSLEILQQHATAKLYLDHDKAAVKEVTFIKQIIPNAEDASHFYSGYKDLNVYLKIQQQQSRGLSL
jgi:Toprim-like